MARLPGRGAIWVRLRRNPHRLSPDRQLVGAGHAVKRYEDLNGSALILICAPTEGVAVWYPPWLRHRVPRQIFWRAKAARTAANLWPA
jgi:hypothetical protein